MKNTFELDENFEYVILNKILYDPSFAIKTFAIIGNRDIFDINESNKLYRYVKGYFEKYNRLPNKKAIDFVTSKHEQISGYLVEVDSIDDDILKDEQFILDSTVDYVKRGLLKRAIIKSAAVIDDPEKYGTIESSIKKAMEVNFDIYLGMSFRKDLDKRIEFSRQYVIDGIKSGIEKIDQALQMGNGYLAKNLYVVSSESNLGKSIALCNFAATGALQAKNVLFVTLEMQESFIGQRIDSITTRIDIGEIYRKEKEEELKRKFNAISMQFGNADIIIKEYPPGSISVHVIRALLNDLRLYQNFIPDMIILDYINLMRAGRSSDNRYHELKHITEELRALAYEFHAPVITASQLNRGGYSHVNPDLDTMGESMGIVHTADFIAILSQTDDEKDAGLLMWHIKKNRLGKKDISFPTVIDYTTLRISDFIKSKSGDSKDGTRTN